MTKLKQIYKCEVCGNIVEVLHEGPGELVCCGQPMQLYEENTTDAAQEKHVPVLERINGGWKVTVGEVAHPMTEKHLIEWIELITDGMVYRKHLTAEDKPEAIFMVDVDKVTARAYCNMHGLWKKE